MDRKWRQMKFKEITSEIRVGLEYLELPNSF